MPAPAPCRAPAARVVDLVVQRVEDYRRAGHLVQPQQVGEREAVFVRLDRHAAARERGQPFEAHREAVQRRRSIAVRPADVHCKYALWPGVERVEQLRLGGDRGGAPRSDRLVGRGERYMQAHVHREADAVRAGQRASLGQQIGALLDLPTELRHVRVGQVRREVVGQPVAADPLLGQVQQYLAHMQQTDAEVRSMFGAPPVARPQPVASQHPHRDPQPDHMRPAPH
jgi:hypothetical protein